MNAVFLKFKNIVLYGSSFKLRPYEQTVLEAWRNHLSPDAVALLNAQLKHLVSYQRQMGDRLLCFFALERKPNASVPDDVLFPCRIGSCVVALMRLSGTGELATKDKIRAEIYLHKGRLSFIEFNKPPQKSLEQGANVTKVEILRDPMVPATDEDVVDAKRREEVLKAIQSKLPEEYLQWVGEGKEISFHEWTVYGLPKIRKIPQRDGNYYLLAEREGMGAVGVKEDEMSGQLYYLDYGDDRGEKISVGLKPFLKQFDGGKVAGRF